MSLYDDIMRMAEELRPDPSLVTKFVGSSSTVDRLIALLSTVATVTHDPSPLAMYSGIPIIRDDDVCGSFLECHNYEGYVIKVLLVIGNSIIEPSNQQWLVGHTRCLRATA